MSIKQWAQEQERIKHKLGYDCVFFLFYSPNIKLMINMKWKRLQ